MCAMKLSTVIMYFVIKQGSLFSICAEISNLVHSSVKFFLFKSEPAPETTKKDVEMEEKNGKPSFDEDDEQKKKKKKPSSVGLFYASKHTFTHLFVSFIVQCDF